MIQRFDTDRQWQELLDLRQNRPPEFKPRTTRYNSSASKWLGLTPLEARPDVFISPSEYAATIQRCHETQSFPMYHQKASWAPAGFRYNQDGIGYCWTWSGTAALMDLRALEGKDTVKLAPVSMGYLVGWADRGNYLEDFIRGAREQGICPTPDGNVNSLNRSAAFWQQYDSQRVNFRLDEVWDTDASSDDTMVQHCISGLCYGRPGYIAYNWWGHALELVGVRFDPSVYKSFVPIIRNSHNEDDFIELTGTRAVPDECYFFVSTQPSTV